MGERTNAVARGAILTREQLLDIVIEARKERKAIRLYRVSQMGHIDVMCITSKSKIHKNEHTNSDFINYRADHSRFGYRKTKDRWFKTDASLRDMNVGVPNGYNSHHLFQNRVLAERYAFDLKADPLHRQSVADHHAWCDQMFNDIWGSPRNRNAA